MSAPLVDIGANLGNKAFAGDVPAVLARASEAAVTTILVTGTSAPASRRALDIALAAPGGGPTLFATAGIHPHHASTASNSTLADVRELASHPAVVAVGECGLDYNRDFSPRDAQRRAFEAQLEIAHDLRMPVFLHERDAHDDFARILAHWRPKLVGGVVHCFTGEGRALDAYLDLDMHVGFTGWICDERRGSHLGPLVRRVPAGRLLVETDAPYILPRDLPGRPKHGRNEPSFLRHVARVVARHRGEPEDVLATHTTAAARDLFGLLARAPKG